MNNLKTSKAIFVLRNEQIGVIRMAQDVLCEVNNCTFWAKGNKCSADSIYVVSHKGKTADTSKETDCKTFEPADL